MIFTGLLVSLTCWAAHGRTWLTLEADTIEEATEYAGHAQIHVDVSRDAYACS